MNNDEMYKTKFEPHTFEDIQSKFREVTKRLDEEKVPSFFRTEYERLFRALEKGYIKQDETRPCENIGLNQVDIRQTCDKNEKPDKTIDELENLRRELKSAWYQVEASKMKELKTAETIISLEEEIEKVSNLMNQTESQKSTTKQDLFLKNIIKERDKLKADLENVTEAVDKLKQQIQCTDNEKKQFENKVKDLEAKYESALETIRIHDGEVQRGKRSKDRLEHELLEVQNKLEQKKKKYVDLQYMSSISDNKSDQLKRELSEAKAEIEKSRCHCECLESELKQKNDSLEYQKKKTVSLSDDRNEARQQLKIKNTECAKENSEKVRLQRKLDQENSSVVSLRQQITNLKKSFHSIQDEHMCLQKELDAFSLREESIQKEVSILNREKNLLKEEIQRSQDRLRNADTESLHKEHLILSLEKQILSKGDEVTKMNNKLKRLEISYGKQCSEATELKVNIGKMSDEIKLRYMEVDKMEKNLAEQNTQLKQKNKECDAIKNVRGKLSRDLVEVKSEVLKRADEIKFLKELVKSLRNEVTIKDETIVKGHFGQKIEKAQREQLTNEVSRLKQLIQKNDQTVQRQNAEIRFLGLAIKRKDDETLRLQKEFNQVINERDILGTQLIRRNDELALLHEKIKIQESTLRKGELQYQDRIEDIRILKLKIQELQPELALVKGGSAISGKIKKDLLQKDRELLQEKIKVKALAEELENPLNIHRWRKLEGSDASTFELIQKVHFLQKRLIKKTEEVIEKDIVIEEKEQKYATVQKLLDRKPDIDAVETSSVINKEVKRQARQMKAMAGELNMHQCQAKEYRIEIDRLNKELQEIKRKYYEQKRKEPFIKEKDIALLIEAGVLPKAEINDRQDKSPQFHKKIPQRSKYVGGGFAVK